MKKLMAGFLFTVLMLPAALAKDGPFPAMLAQGKWKILSSTKSAQFMMSIESIRMPAQTFTRDLVFVRVKLLGDNGVTMARGSAYHANRTKNFSLPMTGVDGRKFRLVLTAVWYSNTEFRLEVSEFETENGKVVSRDTHVLGR